MSRRKGVAEAAPRFGAGVPARWPGLPRFAFIAPGVAPYAGARVALSVPGPEDEAAGTSNPIDTLVQAGMLLGAGPCAAARRAATRRRRRRRPFRLLVAQATASAAWSRSPAGTRRRSLGLGTVVLFVADADRVAGPRG